jgi:hypothetical protein
VAAPQITILSYDSLELVAALLRLHPPFDTVTLLYFPWTGINTDDSSA